MSQGLKMTWASLRGGDNGDNRGVHEMPVAWPGEEGEELFFCFYYGIFAKHSENTENKNKSKHHLCFHYLKKISDLFLHPFPEYVMPMFTYKWFIVFIIK